MTDLLKDYSGPSDLQADQAERWIIDVGNSTGIHGKSLKTPLRHALTGKKVRHAAPRGDFCSRLTYLYSVRACIDGDYQRFRHRAMPLPIPNRQE